MASAPRSKSRRQILNDVQYHVTSKSSTNIYTRIFQLKSHIVSFRRGPLAFCHIIKISIVENDSDLFLVLYLRPVFPLFLHISIIHVFAYENVCGECLSYSHYQVTKWKYSISINVLVFNICISFLIFLSRRHWSAPISKQLFSYPYTMTAIRYVKKTFQYIFLQRLLLWVLVINSNHYCCVSMPCSESRNYLHNACNPILLF